MRHIINRRWLASSYQGRNPFHHGFWNSYRYLLHYQSTNLYAHYMVMDLSLSNPIMLIIEDKLVIIFWTLNPILFNTCLYRYPLLKPHKITYRSSTYLQLRWTTTLGISWHLTNVKDSRQGARRRGDMTKTFQQLSYHRTTWNTNTSESKITWFLLSI